MFILSPRILHLTLGKVLTGGAFRDVIPQVDHAVIRPIDREQFSRLKLAVQPAFLACYGDGCPAMLAKAVKVVTCLPWRTPVIHHRLPPTVVPSGRMWATPQSGQEGA